ncbi:MAG: hypothetical protein D6725_11400 [Planctomycetota bacterium]|nr:MAG: hypothetical protein D6725_11400 [Planctomycetota bacterium]
MEELAMNAWCRWSDLFGNGNGPVACSCWVAFLIVAVAAPLAAADDDPLEPFGSKAAQAEKKLAAAGVRLEKRPIFANVTIHDLQDCDPKVIDWASAWVAHPFHALGSVSIHSSSFRGLSVEEAAARLVKGNPLSLSLAGTDCGEDIWSAISGAPSLEYLNLSGTDVTGERMWQAHGLPRLRRLVLDNTRLDRTAYPALAACFPDLEELSLKGSTITDQDFPFLTKLNRLRTLDLSHTAITTAGLGAIPSQDSPWTRTWNLETLCLRDTEVGNEGLGASGPLVRLPRLDTLDLTRTKVDAEGLREIAELIKYRYYPSLHTVIVEETQVDEKTRQVVEEAVRKEALRETFRVYVVPKGR